TTMSACPPLGMLTNDFARGLIELDARIAEIPNLVVICASDIGQRSWFCEEWRQSIFGHFVLEGFQGAPRDLNDDGRINLAEFFAYVSGSVERWVQSNREACQCPILLPTGEAGLERARRIDLALECRDYRPPDARDTPIFEPPRQLVANWELHDRMAADVPAPWVYTPHLWRRYQDLLLRYEELLRIHDSVSSTVINDQLSELALEIAQTRRMSLSCLQNSLAMPLAAGWSRILDGRITANGTGATIDPTAVFNELWRSSPTDLMPRWSAIRAKLSGHIIAQQTLLFFLREQSLKRAADDFAAHGKKASELVSSLDDPLSIRPAEVHFLVMLGRDLPQPCPRNLSDLVRTALQVRRLAEMAALGVKSDAHPYSEEVTCWTHEIIAIADQHRRAGEDRLFADSSNWPFARRDFEQARAWYQQAQVASAGLARACGVRDQLAAMLPYYSTWLARRTARDAVARDRDEALLDQIETLWHDQHELTARLDQPIALKPAPAGSAAGDHPAANANPAKAAPEIAAIVDCSSAAAESFAALEQSLVESLRELVDIDLPSVWRDA
ncbi:MAG TPA: hypothetical protein VHY20_15825, partial [Pirellulales bacterium]|nr:hypothetical protein [Pirellulales bacterium]